MWFVSLTTLYPQAFGSQQVLGYQTSLNPNLFYTSYIGKSVWL